MKKQNLKTEWNLSLLLKSTNEESLAKERKKIDKYVNEFVKKWNESSNWLTNDSKLLEALDEYEYWSANHGTYDDEYIYYYLAQSLDESNPEIKAKYNSIHTKAVELHTKMQFFEIRLSKISSVKQKEFLISNKLQKYKHYLERVFRQGEHTLSEPEERIMAKKSKVSHSNWALMLSSMLGKQDRKVLTSSGKREMKNFSELIELFNDKKQSVRNESAKAVNGIFLEHLDVAENEFNSILEDKQVNDSLRGFKRPDEGRHMEDDISASVVDELVRTVTEKFSVSRDYYKFKARLFGKKKLLYHERNMDYGKVEKKYSFEQAYDFIYKVFTNLDPDFANRYQTFFENGQVDMFPKKGKRPGAFAIANLITQPSYVCLNFTQSSRDLEVIAHEFGHAFHFELAKEQQHALSFDFPMCIAETASTFFEDFVTDEILKKANDEERLSLLVAKLNNDVSTIFRQIAFYNFETEIHAIFREKGYLSHVEIGKIFSKHMHSYMGDGISYDEGSENWWIYISHFRSFFYVYSYAFGLLVSKYFQKKVKENKDDINIVRDFLASGNERAPSELLIEQGIDISKKQFWLDGISEIEALLTEAKSLARKLKKI